MGGGDVFLDADLREGDGLVLVEVELEFLVLATGVFEQLHGLGLLGDAISFRSEFELRDFGINGALLLRGFGLGKGDLRFAESNSGGRGGFAFGDGLLGRSILRGRFLTSIRQGEQFLRVKLCGLLGSFGGLDAGESGLLSGELRGLFCGLGFFDFLDQLLLRVFLGVGQSHLLLPVGGGEGLGVLHLLLLDNDGLLQRHTVFDDFLDVFLLDFDSLFFLDALERGDALTLDDFEVSVAGDALDFDGVGALLVALGNENLPIFVLSCDGEFFFGGDPRALGFEALLVLNLRGFRFFTCDHAGDIASLLGAGLCELALKLQDGLLRLHILLFDDLFLIALDLVGQLCLCGGQLSDLFDAFRIQDVFWIEILQLGLLEEVDGAVVESKAVQISADDFQDLVLKGAAFIVELDEIEPLADGLQGLGELGVK